MVRTARWTAFLALAAVMFVCTAFNAQAAPVDPDIEESARRVAPHIEAVTGLRFSEPINVRWISREDMQSIMMEERDYDLKATGKEDDPMDRVTAQFNALRESRLILGKYSFIRREVYFVRENVLDAIPAMKLSDNWQVEVIDALVAHELTHALDDQHFRVSEAVIRIERTEPLVAYRALEEGHAIFVASQVCQRLNYPDHSTEMALIHDPGDPNDPRTAGSFPRESLLYFQYAQGAEFIKELFRQGGPELVRKAFENPPVFASQIYKPQMYLGKTPPVPELEAILTPADKVPGDGLDKKDFEANEILLRMGFQRLGAAKTDLAASGFITGRSRDFMKAGSEKKALITVFCFADFEGARRFYVGEEELMLAQWEDIAGRKGSEFAKVRRIELPLGDGCVWSQAAYRSVGGEAIDDQQVFVQVGRLVFEVAVFNMNMSDASIQELLKGLVESGSKALETVDQAA